MVALEHIGSANLVVTPFILLILAAVPLLDKKFAPTGRRALWAMVMVGLMWPFVALITPHQPAVPIAVHLAAVNESAPAQAVQNFYQYTQSVQELDQLKNANYVMQDLHIPIEAPILPQSILAPTPQGGQPSPALQSTGAANAFTFRLPNTGILLVTLWVAGIIIFALYQWFRHFKLMRFLKRWQIPVSEDIAAVFAAEKYSLGIGKDIRLVHAKKLTATMLTGLTRPTIYLADMDYTTKALRLIFRHELMHYKRKDLWYKLALTAMQCLYWYNPAVHLMARQADKDLETLCDHATVQGMDMAGRKYYSNLILRMAAGPIKSPLTTYILGGKDMLKQRLTNILHTNRPTNKRFLVTLGIALLLTGFFVGIRFSQDAPPYIYEAEQTTIYETEANAPETTAASAPEEILSEEATASFYEPSLNTLEPFSNNSMTAGIEDTGFQIAYFDFHIPYIPAGERVLVGRIDDFEPGLRVELKAEALEGHGIFVGLTSDPNLSRYGSGLGSWRPFSSDARSGSISTGSVFHPGYVYFYIGSWSAEVSLYDITASVTISPNVVWSDNDALNTMPPVPPNMRTHPPLIGIHIMHINATYRDLFQLPSVGIMVTDVLSGGGAEAAGIQARDLIVAFDGTPVTTLYELNNARNAASVGQEVILTIYRDDERLQVPVTLG